MNANAERTDGDDFRSTADLLRETDWSATAIGPFAAWPQSLRTAVDLMLASGHAMCLAWGPERTFLYNDAYALIMGGRHPAAFGMTFREAWPEIYDEIEPLVERTFAGETMTFQDMPLVMTRNGYPEDTWWTFSYSPVRDEGGRVSGLLNVTLETTARLAAERERDAAVDRLRGSEERLRALVEASADSIYSMNPDWTEMRQLDGRGFIPNTDAPSVKWMEAYLPPEERPVVQDAIDEAIATGKPFELEHRVRRVDGRIGWTASRAVPVRGPDGAIVEWFGMAADVTPRRRAELQLRQLNETLEVRVEERSQELMAAEDRVRQMQKMEAIGQLTGGVAHDFNNLLTIIRSSADLLRRQELPAEKRRRYIDAISDTADRAAKLTAQLLAFARRQALKPEVFDAADRVSSIADMLQTVVGARIELHFEQSCATCYVEADASQFETALVNMAVNARDAMDGEGGLAIAVAAASAVPAVRGHASVPGDFVSISVTDTGYGIASDQLDRIFEPFFTTKDIGKGTGLGLSQVYGFAKQTGGDVAVTSTVGEGTTFTLYLPSTDAPPEPKDDARAAEPEIRSHGNILVVEDNEQVGEFASQLLNDLGYSTRYASNARDAMAMLESGHDAIDIVFSDVVMPGESGVDLGRRVRARWPDMMVVLTSGYSHVLADDARHGFALLHKPYSVEELSRVLRRARERSG